MNARNIRRRPGWLATPLLTVAILGAFAAWRPALRPDPRLPPPPPPVLVHAPADAAIDDYHEAGGGRRAAFSPALFALSDPCLRPLPERLDHEAVVPPLDFPSAPVRLAEAPASPPFDAVAILSPPTAVVPPRLPSRAATVLVRPSPGANRFRLSWQGTPTGGAVNLAALLSIAEPVDPWAFEASLAFDDDGLAQRVLLESANLPETLRPSVIRALYACRRVPATAGEGRLAMSGPGRRP